MKQKTLALPKQISKYFWGDNIKDLSWTNHKNYIIQTILEKGNQTAIRWLMARVTKSQLKTTLPKLKLNKKSSNFWKLYLS